MRYKRVNHFLQLTEQNIQGEDVSSFHASQVSSPFNDSHGRVMLLCVFLLCVVSLLIVEKKSICIMPWFHYSISMVDIKTMFHQGSMPKDHLSAKKEVARQEVPAPVLNQREQYLKSDIPPFHVASYREVMQVVPLKRLDLMMSDLDESEKISMVMVDKVIVLPKTMSIQLKQVV